MENITEELLLKNGFVKNESFMSFKKDYFVLGLNGNDFVENCCTILNTKNGNNIKVKKLKEINDFINKNK
jgi:hypothetical protein